MILELIQVDLMGISWFPVAMLDRDESLTAK